MPHQSGLSSTIITNINEMELHQLQMLTCELQEMRKTMEKGTGIYRVCTAMILHIELEMLARQLEQALSMDD